MTYPKKVAPSRPFTRGGVTMVVTQRHFLGVGHKIEIDYYIKLDYHTKFQVIWLTCSAAVRHAVPQFWGRSCNRKRLLYKIGLPHKISSHLVHMQRCSVACSPTA